MGKLLRRYGVAAITIFLLLLPLISYVPTVRGVEKERLERAAQYLVSHYNPALGLIWESEEPGQHWLSGEYPWMAGIPYNRTYWLYGDNLLALYALKPYNKAVSDAIRSTLNSYGYNETHNPPLLWEVLFGYDIPDEMGDASNLVIRRGEDYAIFARRHNATNPLNHTLYADALIYHSLDLLWNGKRDESNATFRKAYSMFDGKGVYDDATRVNGFYANYKLALLLYAGKILNNLTLQEMGEIEGQLWKMQDPNTGGIISLADLDGNPMGSSNCETTSLTLLAYDEDLIANLRGEKADVSSPALQWWQLAITLYAVVVIIVVAAFLLAVWVYKRRWGKRLLPPSP